MNYSERELATLLKENPDIAVSGPVIEAVIHALDGSPRHALVQITSEHAMQCAVIAKCQERAQTNPLYELIYAIPNGGYRGKSQGGKLKAEGVKAGMPDLHLPVARHGRHSLYLELKFGDGKLSKEQQWWIRRLRVEGHCVEVVWDSPDEVMKILDWYLER